MSDQDVNVNCSYVYGMLVCVNDYIEIYPRSRALISFRGLVKKITTSSIILSNEENDIAIRLSEIKALRKLKIK